jgi:hypothetical protein
LVLFLAACSSGPKAPPNAGQIIVQAGTGDSTVVHQWAADLTGPTVNIGPSTAGIAISPAGTPIPGALYVPGKGNNFYRINPGSSPISISTAGTVTSSLQIAPASAKNAGAALVLTDQGLSTLQASGAVTDIAIPDAVALAVAPKGASNAGTAYITSKTSSSLYIVDPLATSARTVDIGMAGGGLAVAPKGTPDVGTVFIYPDPDDASSSDLQPAGRLTEVSPAGDVRAAALPGSASVSGSVVAAVAPAKTPHAGSLYFAGLSDGRLYQLSPAADLSSLPLPLDSAGYEGMRQILIADAGSKNAGCVYIGTDRRILKVDPTGQVATMLTGDSVSNAPALLAIAPAKTPTAGTAYVATAPNNGSTIVAIKPDGSQATFALADQVKPTSGIVTPAGTKLAGTLLVWGFYGQGIGSLSPDGQTGVYGGDIGITAVAVVPK